MPFHEVEGGKIDVKDIKTMIAHVPAPVLPSDVFKAHPPGTRVRIGADSYVRLDHGSFWRKENDPRTASLPSAMMEHLENVHGAHQILELGEAEDFRAVAA